MIRAGWLQRHAWFVVAGLLSGGCCCDLDLSELLLTEESDEKGQRERVNLGLVRFPPNTDDEEEPAVTRWKAPSLDPSRYELAYLLGRRERRASSIELDELAKSVGYDSLGTKRFRWARPPHCDSDLQCIYQMIGKQNLDRIKPIAMRMLTAAKDEDLSSREFADLVLSYVQDFRYEEPEIPFGILPPALVVAERRGDCDSKALLAHIIFSYAGIESVLISSQAHRHAMLGVALPASGKTFSYRGRRYAYAECTAKGAPLGFIGPQLLSPDDWRVLPVPLHVEPIDLKATPRRNQKKSRDDD